jgi:mono/diheme cytochrome c family protein
MLERVAARQRLNQKEPVQLVASCEPEGWFAMLDRNAPELAFASPIDRNLFWPGRADVSFIPPKIAKAAEMSLEEFGKRLYSNCMSCHQANGRGLPPVYPPLRGSDIVLGDPETLVKILLHGLEGKLEVDGQAYNQVMPAAPVRGDDEIAAVLTYVRSAWGNSAGAVDAALVAKVREETKGRNRSFTTKELGIAPE